jgi:uncharacterized protein
VTDDWSLVALRQQIAADARLAELCAQLSVKLGSDPAHDIEHALRVALWTLRIGAGAVEPRAAIAAALLHDVVNHPKDSPLRSRSSHDAAELARELLPQYGFEGPAASEICDAIVDHSFSAGRTPRSALGRALSDADRLEALGAIGLVRCLLTGARMSALPFCARDPFARERELDDRAYSVDHFFTKLLGLAERMHTETGRIEAVRRARVLEQFLSALSTELEQPLTPARRGDG